MNTALENVIIDQPSPPLLDLVNGRKPSTIVAMRASGLPDIVSLPIRSLFPYLPAPLWTGHESIGPTSLDVVREKTRERLQKIDWSKIQKGDSVNLIANPHGFYLCGEAYVVMLEETAKHVHDTTGGKVRLRIAESMGHIENPDWMTLYDLPGRFGKGTKETPQISRGIKCDTKLGPFWLTHELFNAKHFIHTHVTEMREGYLHRMIDRLYKPFGMAYTRTETRSAYHFSFGPRTGQMVSRAVFNSDFIQQRYVGTVVLETTAEGIVGIEGDNDLGALDRRTMINTFKNYGPLYRLFGAIKEAICIFDGHGSGVYTYAAGTPWDNFFCANTDYFDLDKMSFLSTEGIPPGIDSDLLMGFNPAIKAVVMNYQALGVPNAFIFKTLPTYLVGKEFTRWMRNDPSSCFVEPNAIKMETLPEALSAAMAKTGTDRVIVYDNSPGIFRVSRSLAQDLLAAAPGVEEDVMKNYLPKWLSQRGLL